MPSVPPKDKEKTRKKPGRVPTSCAECRRLKLRCDKNVPCGKCVSRGCGSICPDGHLASGKGNRLILANTEELHDRVENLCARIRELEDALRALQETVSDRPHPLLRTDLLHIKSRSQPSAGGPSPASSDSHSTLVDEGNDSSPRVEEENFIDSFGTLTLGLNGEANFLGQTARSEYLFRALTKTPPTRLIPPPRLSRRIVELSFPDPDVVDQELGREIYEHLPSLSEAMALVDTYVEHGAYLPINLERKELLDGVLEVVYRAGSFDNLKNHHTLPLLFAVFATAALLDPNRPPYSMESQEYYYLSRAALGISSPVRETTIPAIQALIHMAQYLDLSDWEGSSSNSAWIYVGTAVRLALGIGLHLDSSRWSLCDDWGQQRRRVFWQLFIADTWVSFSLGRPPSLSIPHVDCSYPNDTSYPSDAREVPVADRDKEVGYFLWTCKYSSLMQSIMATAFGSKSPSYSTILSLDRKVRDFYIPFYLRPTCGHEIPPPTALRQVQRFLALTTKENTLLNLHRAYFVQALQDKPDDLANHRFIPSVMAAYRSAWRLIRALVIIWKDAPLLISRIGSAWSPALSAAIVMCILVTRAPTSKMTKSSLEELDALSRLFLDASASSRFAAHLQPPITGLALKAHRAVDDTSDPPGCDVTHADLDRLGGKTHLIHPNMTPTPSTDSSSSAGSPVPPLRAPGMFSDGVATTSGPMHPTIAQDMRSFDLGEPSQFYDLFQLSDAGSMPNLQFTGAVGDVSGGGGSGGGGGGGGGGGNGNSVLSPQLGGGGYGFTSSAFVPMSGTPPMLDATWQSFVEQLGF